MSANLQTTPAVPIARATTNALTGVNAAHCRSEDYPSVATPDAAHVLTDQVDDGAASALPAPYYCKSCGADSPYLGRRPRHKGGNGCKACSAVEKQIAARQRAAYSAISTAAYQPGVCGDEKRAILARAIEVSSRAWRDAQIAFGIDLGREDRLALATALTDAGTALLDAGQDVALAADRQVAA